MRTKEKKKKSKIYRIISIILILVSILFLGILFYIDLIPTKYMAILTIIILIFDTFNVLLLNLRRLKIKVKKVITFIVSIAMPIMLIGSFYICRTLGVLSNNGDSKYKLEHYSVIVLKSSDYKSLKDIKNKTVGYYENSAGAKIANDRLKKDVDVKFESYSSSDTLVNDLLNSKVDAILLEDSIKKIMAEESSTFTQSIKEIHKFTIKVKVEETLKDVNVTKKPFAIYISGIDTYGEIASVSRSDVNMVVVVNPTTKQILLVSIPRDYYVKLHGKNGSKDKLTHAGIYGIDMSIKTIEDLLDMEINYYLKVNFTSVIDIVEALGGLEVYSEYTFVSYSGFSFKKGYNKVNGEQALDFARTRKAFSTGDRQRGKNQQALIEAVIRKATSKSIITKYNSLLSAIDGKYQTNMSTKKITSLIKMQLNDMSTWNITSYSLSGTDSNNYTYTYNQLLYVMEPNKDSITEASLLIDKVTIGESLESTYGEVKGTVNKVNKTSSSTSSNSSKPKTSSTNKPNDTNKNQNTDGDVTNNKKMDSDDKTSSNNTEIKDTNKVDKEEKNNNTTNEDEPNKNENNENTNKPNDNENIGKPSIDDNLDEDKTEFVHPTEEKSLSQS